jgi:HK97 gp10 family phage protein
MESSVDIIKYGDPKKGVEAGLKEGTIELLMKVTAAAKSFCTEDTGILKNSIMWKTREQSGGHSKGNVLKQQPKDDEGIVGSATEYAAYVEFGTRNMAAHPYLRPAVETEALGSSAAAVLKKYSIENMKEELKKRQKVNK